MIMVTLLGNFKLQQQDIDIFKKWADRASGFTEQINKKLIEVAESVVNDNPSMKKHLEVKYLK